MPNAQQVAELSGELRSRAALPPYVTKVLAALPPGTHPMTQLSVAVLALQVSRVQGFLYTLKRRHPAGEQDLQLLARAPFHCSC